MQIRVTVPADQLEIVEGQSDGRVGDVLRRDVNLVMDDVARLVDPARQTDFTQSPAVGGVVSAAGLPRCALVESFGVFFHGILNERHRCETIAPML